MDASNAPVRHAPRELHTDDIEIQQHPVIETRQDLAEEIVIAPAVLQKEYAEALKFAEEPVTIRIERSSEKFAPNVIDLWCNGHGPEILQNGRWVTYQALPVGVVVTTKRKYVEILARSKVDSVQTEVTKEEHGEKNEIARSTSSRAPFSVIRDDSPKGVAWLNGLVSFG